MIRRGAFSSSILLLSVLLGACGQQQTPVEVHLNIRSHLFEPDVLRVPANTPVKLVIHNLDSTPEEFESRALNREKLVLAESTVILMIGPLMAGEYPFSGIFNPHTAVGIMIAAGARDANH